MKIAVIGTGYVGLVTGACFADRGHTVICVDKVEQKIDDLKKGIVPIYEPGLKELIDRNVAADRLYFSVDTADAVRQSEVIIIAVGTPPGPGGEPDLSYVRSAAKEIGQAMRGHRVVVTKSTVPVGTTDLVAGILAEHTPYPFDVVSNPEFLREGSAVEDCLNPDRIVIGASNPRGKEAMIELYRTFDAPLVVVDPRSAELIKYASNAFLAVKISFINEMAALCEQLGADVLDVARGMGYDERIGPAFLRAGIGFGGSCFPKDTQALIHTAGKVESPVPIIEAAVEVNRRQRELIPNRLQSILGTLKGTVVAIYGLAFKPHTDDVRESPALEIIDKLILQGAVAQVYDPKANETAKVALEEMGIDVAKHVRFAESPLEAARGADALVLATEWPEFATLSWKDVIKGMRRPVLIDGRNYLDPQEMKECGFVYSGIGRGASATSLGFEPIAVVEHESKNGDQSQVGAVSEMTGES